VALIAAALAGFGLASIVIWVVDAAGPTRAVPAVITRDDRVAHDDDNGLRYEYVDQARTDDGELVGLPSREQLSDSVTYGSPVRIEFSTITRNVVSVRSAEGLIRTGTGTVGLILLGFSAAALIVGTLAVGRLDAPRSPAIAAGVAGFALPILLLLDTPAIGSSQELTARGYQIYNDTGFFPKTIAPTGQRVTVGDMTVRVSGPVTTTPPPGAPSWLAGFHVVTVPVEWTHTGPYERGYQKIELIGPGSGIAEIVRAPACGGAPGGFDGDVDVTTELPRRGVMCYVVPPDFRPEHLIVGVDPSAAITLTTSG
jgi:hypothetical protein